MNNDNVLEVEKKGKVTIITTSNNKYVLKYNTRDNKFYEYLNVRNFNYFPKIYSNNSSKLVMEYIESKELPLEQKLEDMIYLISILHLNTMFDKKVDLDFIKEIYEDIRKKQDYLMNYYLNMQNLIEEEVYMSPANYLLIRNISLIYLSINHSKEYLDKFYDLVKDNTSFRYSYIHGNLDINHLLENDNLYLISWDKSKLDLPIYDLVDFFRRNHRNIDLDKVLTIYEKKIPLKKEEKYLLFSLLLLPDEIINKDEYLKTKEVSNKIFYIEELLDYLKDNSKKSNNNTYK